MTAYGQVCMDVRSGSRPAPPEAPEKQNCSRRTWANFQGRFFGWGHFAENDEKDRKMKSKISRASLIALFTVISFASSAAADESERLALQFLGTATGTSWDLLSEATVAEIDMLAQDGNFNPADLEGFGCFEIDLVDPSSGVVVGTGVDCLAPTPVGPEGNVFDAIEVEAFSFFILPGGAFVSNGLTSVRAFLPGIGDGDGFTHVTGSLPEQNNILAATGQFKDKGSTRVSGAVDLSQFGAGIVAFNCLWIVDIKIN
ncbi:MAG: hypothetical protein KAR37_16310 [Alphaproteobacteria bacterium]|nr:hypothetical protein [Alphaproteobacteria bacterium]